jgi:2-dehydropantoate 2-reductase
MTAAGYQALNLPGVPIGWLGRFISLPAWLLKPLLQRMVASGRGGKRPSMYYDVDRGRTEIEWLHGAVAEKADEIDLPSPANHLLTKEVRNLPAGSRLPVGTLLAKAAMAGVPGLAGYNRAE